MDYFKYMDSVGKPNNFIPTGITTDHYLDVIEICVKAYNMETLIKRLPEPGGMVDDIHAYSRIACGIAALLSNGRIPEYTDLWYSMMDALCNDFYRQLPPNTLDFALKETMLGFKAMKPYVSKEKQEYWLSLLGRIDPFKNFTNQHPFHEWDNIRNWNIYAMAGLWLLETEGYADSSAFFDKYWEHQFKYFDDNGMYMDPHNPMLYDLTTRVQAQLIPGYGYRGKYFEQLDEYLKKGALASLFSQSSAFEFPYGGRSNQFLFNESLLTSNFEYEAVRWKTLGNARLAGMYKRAAHLAIQSIRKWLDAPGVARHIKNMYPITSKFGSEGYGYYDKYMMTLGVFLFIGFHFSDDSIEEFPCPAETGGYVFETSGHFHKLFANCGSYSIEIDTAADFFYDATGLGRIHKTGCPSELALSASSGELHSLRYPTPGAADEAMALCPGWVEDGRYVFLGSCSKKENHSFAYVRNEYPTEEAFTSFVDSFRHNLISEIEVLEEAQDFISFRINYSGSADVSEIYTLSSGGVVVESVLNDSRERDILYLIPAFLTNGIDESSITYDSRKLVVSSMGFRYVVETDGTIEETRDILGNRNGLYGKYIAHGKGRGIKVAFSLEKEQEI
ncbi:MAG: hypothetical protein JXN10_11640 [Clostridia bacterium]|nr:hypothetical protein [Clostridia bacterium]MBN2884173.1 hypothetical protein [Clostridia bacterium]